VKGKDRKGEKEGACSTNKKSSRVLAEQSIFRPHWDRVPLCISFQWRSSSCEARRI